MSPTPGTRLNHYEIVETIGKGGMGEVYRARDTRLPRDADIDMNGGFRAGTPRRLFSAPPPLAGFGWALTPDDKRFLFITMPNAGRPDARFRRVSP